MKKEQIKKIVKDRYSEIAKSSSNQSCNCCSCAGGQSQKDQNVRIAKEIGYSEEEIEAAPGANLGLGCGNPTAISDIAEGEIVLDLGSGAGFDCFLASKKVGKAGHVIGVDMSEEMISKAKALAKKDGTTNIEFRLGDIEELPVRDNSVNVVISNCVINLAPDKEKVFKEAFRVLKTGGRMFVSDIVLLGELPAEVRNNEELLAGCVGGAVTKDEYLALAKSAGFKIEILSEDKDISKTQYQDFPLESLKIKLIK